MYSSDRPYNDFRAPPPTYSERKLRSILRSKKVPFKDSQIIWYTGCDRYTPDLLIGKKFIVEVDGKVHDKDFQKTPDRIRQRALENMGYNILRVKNEEIQNTPDVVAERITQKYIEVIEAEEDSSGNGTRTKSVKITELEKPLHYEPIPREITNDKLRLWALSFNQELITNKESAWSVDYFKKSLTQLHPKLVTNQCAISSQAASKIAAQRNTANNPSNSLFKVSPLTLVYIAYGVIIGIPAAVAVTYFLYRKGII